MRRRPPASRSRDTVRARAATSMRRGRAARRARAAVLPRASTRLPRFVQATTSTNPTSATSVIPNRRTAESSSSRSPPWSLRATGDPWRRRPATESRRKKLVEPLGDGLHFRRCRGDRHLRCEAAKDGEPSIVSCCGARRRRPGDSFTVTQCEWNPELRAHQPSARTAERGRRHADNLEGFSGDRHGGADDPRIGREPPSPQRIAQHHHTSAAGIVARLNRASELGAHAERGEADPLTDSPMTISVTDGRARRRTNVADAATWENDVWAVCTSRKSGSDTVPVSSRPLCRVTMTATRSGSWMPRPRRNTASTIEYTAVVIATPTASERIAKVVKRRRAEPPEREPDVAAHGCRG